MEERSMPLIGDPAPHFKANTTQGPISFPQDFAGKWVVLFSHPSDFTPVCTTEFMVFGKEYEEFKKMNAELLGLSVDSLFSHIAWLRKIRELEWNGISDAQVCFPLIEDLKMEVSSRYGMIHPNQSATSTVRAVFIIDPSAVIRAILYYPQSVGRNMDEIKRMLKALQKNDAEGVVTPANWREGDDVIVPPPGSCGAAMDRMASPEPGTYCLDWFLCFKKEGSGDGGGK